MNNLLPGRSAWNLLPGQPLDQTFKPNYGGSRGFGKVATLSGTGKTFVVGVPGESSWAAGINGDRANTGRPGSGTLFMY